MCTYVSVYHSPCFYLTALFLCVYACGTARVFTRPHCSSCVRVYCQVAAVIASCLFTLKSPEQISTVSLSQSHPVSPRYSKNSRPTSRGASGTGLCGWVVSVQTLVFIYSVISFVLWRTSFLGLLSGCLFFLLCRWSCQPTLLRVVSQSMMWSSSLTVASRSSSLLSSLHHTMWLPVSECRKDVIISGQIM